MNGEGYRDPTADTAIKNAEKKKKKCNVSGFEAEKPQMQEKMEKIWKSRHKRTEKYDKNKE